MPVLCWGCQGTSGPWTSPAVQQPTSRRTARSCATPTSPPFSRASSGRIPQLQFLSSYFTHVSLLPWCLCKQISISETCGISLTFQWFQVFNGKHSHEEMRGYLRKVTNTIKYLMRGKFRPSMFSHNGSSRSLYCIVGFFFYVCATQTIET